MSCLSWRGKEHNTITISSFTLCPPAASAKEPFLFSRRRALTTKYIYVDQLPIDTKNEIKKILRERFKENVAFPFAVIDNSDHLVGFIQPDWVRTLGLTEGE